MRSTILFIRTAATAIDKTAAASGRYGNEDAGRSLFGGALEIARSGGIVGSFTSGVGVGGVVGVKAGVAVAVGVGVGVRVGGDVGVLVGVRVGVDVGVFVGGGVVFREPVGEGVAFVN